MTAPEKEGANLTPLIDVAFLILIFFMCLPFRTLDAKLAAHLPEEGFGPTGQPPQKFVIKVHILGRDEQPRIWGGREVPAPTRVLYRFESGRVTADLEVVMAHIRKSKRAAEGLLHTVVRGEIKAAPRVQHKYAIALLNRFAEAGITDVDFYGARLPGRRELRARTLPYPRARSER
ncbi:MAG: ExbD/TolR family protein [Planctomycetota bacterium]|jgi:biopolymer transport protein ExbD